jgi:hypothetical protein
MKYPNRIIINIIIQNLNKIRAPIKTDKQMLVSPAGLFQNSVILDSFESPTNVILSFAMLESRFTELYVNVHVEHKELYHKMSLASILMILNYPHKKTPGAKRPGTVQGGILLSLPRLIY